MIFLNSVSSSAALVFYLPCVFTHTNTKEEQRKARVRKNHNILNKNTIFNEHPVSKMGAYINNFETRLDEYIDSCLEAAHAHC